MESGQTGKAKKATPRAAMYSGFNKFLSKPVVPETAVRNIDPKAIRDKDVEQVYDLLEEVGKGAFSVVRKAKHKDSSVEYAIKIVDKQRHTGELDLMSQEVTVMRQLKDCKRVVHLKETYETDAKFYLVEEFISGGELFNKIVSKGFYSEADGAFLIKQILEGVAYMHERNIIHRDLKPENLLCATADAEDLDVKLSDFGLAREVPPGKTITGRYGSPQYMAPEIWRDKPYGLKVDMWSLGVISFILLGGYFPFRETADNPLLEVQITKCQYSFTEESWDDVSSTAQDFIKKLLVLDPEKRLSAAEALKHPFFSKSHESTANRAFVLAKIKGFNALRKFKSAVLAVITSNRMAHILNLTSRIREEWRKSTGRPASPYGVVKKDMDEKPAKPEKENGEDKKEPKDTSRKAASASSASPKPAVNFDSTATSTPPSTKRSPAVRKNSSRHFGSDVILPVSNIRLFINTDRALVTEVRQVSVSIDNNIVIPNVPKHIIGSTLFFRTIDNEELDIAQTRINKSTGTITLKLSPAQASNFKATHLQLFYESKKLALKLGYSATFNEDMSAITLSGVYNLINNSGRSYNAATVTLEQYSDSSMDLKDPLVLMDSEDIILQFLNSVELAVTQEEPIRYVAKILTDSAHWFVLPSAASNDQIKKMWSGGITLYVPKSRRRKPTTATAVPTPNIVYVSSGWLTAKSEEEHEKTQRDLRHKRVLKQDSTKKLVRMHSARQVRATIDFSAISPDRTKSGKNLSKEKDKEKKKDKS